MKHLFSIAILFLLLLTINACGQPMKQPEIQLNPQPKTRYELMLIVQDPPGPFDSVIAYANYETDTDCVPEAPITAANYGAKYPLKNSVVAVFHPSGAGTYQGTIHLDLLKDEDYYGLGVCHWHLTSFSVSMKAGEVTFSAAVVSDEIFSGQTKVEFFPKSYFDDPSVIKDTHASGMPMSEFVARAPTEFFSTSLTAKESFE